jgi:hypothetical protein
MIKGEKHRLYCVAKGCKHFTVMVLVGKSVGYYYNKKYGIFDTRNIGFVCPEHQKAYNRYYKREGLHKKYGVLGKGKALI